MKKILLGICLVSSLGVAYDLPYSGTTMYKEFIKIEPTFDSAFTGAETEFLQEAIDLLQSRFLLHRVEECTINNRRQVNVVPGYWNEMSWPNNDQARNATLGFQLAFFRRNPSGKPLKLDVRAFNERGGGYAFGPIAIVKTRYQESQVGEVKGDFLVRINRSHFLLDAEERKSASFYAGTIGHEMLHNMGHEHSFNDFEGNEIIVFDKCVETNGYLTTDSGSGTKEKVTTNPKTGKKVVRLADVCEKKSK